MAEQKMMSCTFKYDNAHGNPRLMKRATILDGVNNILNKDGELCIDVTIQVKDKLEELYDPNKVGKHQDDMLKLLGNKEKADVSVNIGGTIFNLHSLILDNNAPILADYCKQNNGSGENENIGDMTPVVFQMIIEYVYSGYRPHERDVGIYGKKLIDAANRFELVELKLAVERIFVRERLLDNTNVADYILFADSQSCPLLKEYAISYFLLHAKEILKSDSSKSLRESGDLLSEIIMLVSGQDEDGMSVNELREELSRRNVDVDGSKEALISRLDEAKRQEIEH